MKLKCIGGLSDGKIINTECYLTGDQVRVSLKVKFEISTFEEDLKSWGENRTPDYLTAAYEYYKVEEFNVSDKQKIKFLIPMNWTVKDAMEHLLGC